MQEKVRYTFPNSAYVEDGVFRWADESGVIISFDQYLERDEVERKFLASEGPEPKLPDDITEEERQYIYQNPEGEYIFTPVYEIYNDTFVKEIVANTRIKGSYDMFRDTSWMERYMLNAYQFSSAKSVTKTKLMQRAVYKSDGSLKPWNQFRDDAAKIQKTVNENWLRVERDMCARSSIMADKWADMIADADLYPYWIYSGRLDSRERPEHRALEGLMFRIGDPYGDAMCPPEDWNCRCRPLPKDDRYVRANNRSIQTDAQARAWLNGVDENGKPFVDPQFRYNPYETGMMPHNGSYFVDYKNSHSGNSGLYGAEPKGESSLEGFAAQRFTDVNSLVSSWRDLYHEDHLGNVIFQNKNLYSNIILTPGSVHNMHHHPKGAEALPATLMYPNEVWSDWENVDKQNVVTRNYLLFGAKFTYVAQTRNGIVTDAKLVSKGRAEGYRVGCPWFEPNDK
jgi:SPP1 gp7 family putative phage head morphogenesis protein